ncbi:Phenylalanyl-tRNA synthetase beta chain [hydrothermal vent metagenome]|uniref:Phenylalanine--tRNA ligase beta subunit n=1 Tax=hydrothermal vent metagenome TaxID=652676 RepID=A0A3B1AQ56_9ZZZZ
MKFSEAWLREWVNPDVTTDELSDQLSMAGLEVDSVHPAAPEFSGVVVGEVLAIAPHSDAQKLRVCTVNIGADENLSIVCGAANVAAGMRVPVACVGAKLPGGFKIKKAKLRGVPSFGMICSASELGLAESSDGIMPLPTDAPVGEDICSYLRLNDHVIEVDLTPDRGDCLGLAGIARDVGVINRCPVTPPKIEPVAASINDVFEVKVKAPEACPRYVCRVIRGINPTAETPLWMSERLRRSDIRCISPVVDVTNYVLLELGQPMHGFDLERLDGCIKVRMAESGERLTLLDGQEVELKPDTLVIADANAPVAMAGIMGGEASSVTDDTKNILLESAFFSPMAILGKARGYGLHTDSSHRFERGVDPELQIRAVERATALLLDIVGGKAGPVVEVSASEHVLQRPQIHLRSKRVERILGVQVADDEITDILTRLEMQVEPVDGGWMVTAPSCRFDVAIEVDLIEEVGRIYGYSNIPTTHAPSSMPICSEPEIAFDLHRAKQVLVDRDYQEVITYSFVSPELQGLMNPGYESVHLANPISAEMSVMRTSLWSGLVQTACYNQARQQHRIRIFESGLRFLQQGDEIQQNMMLAGLVTGGADPEQWGQQGREADFFDLKADLEAIFSLTGCAEEFIFSTGDHPSLHPGQTAKIERNGNAVGWLGMLHPELEKKQDLIGKTLLFEVHVGALLDGRLPAFAPLSKFPSIRRDIALVLDKGIEFGAVRDCIRRAAPKILTDIRLFDVYTGEKVDSGRRSVALGLILQETSHTLTDEKVESVVDNIVRALNQELNAHLRE